MRDTHDPVKREPRQSCRRRLADGLKAVGRIEPLVALAVQIGSLIVTVTSNWPGNPHG
ncbi:hypothetical protein [Streptomyces sp. TLI_185]|uniref:hypothetical protein n=1 Tax=Streptomyces sp. TLI_185 TaxID=2485151 RepID=UPI000FB6CC94|nr:hypothetical protein [Streptomyces sp. TLI_185]RPF24883.1 hypothetical protein EDD92_9834 [Streptomyces sp. TLI_185]